ncbi:MAG: TrmH family RNA methyltransferase [Terriglobales bacterium]
MTDQDEAPGTLQRRQLGSTDLKRLHRDWKRRPRPRLTLLLENLSSPFNIGSIVRTAAAFGVDRLYIVGRGDELRNAKAQKVALGSERFLTWDYFDDAASALHAARTDNFTCVALELTTGAVPLHEADLNRDICLVVGHEDRGVSPGTIAGCELAVFIPQLGKIGSLNVGNATAIGCAEARRQAWQSQLEA